MVRSNCGENSRCMTRKDAPRKMFCPRLKPFINLLLEKSSLAFLGQKKMSKASINHLTRLASALRQPLYSLALKMKSGPIVLRSEKTHLAMLVYLLATTISRSIMSLPSLSSMRCLKTLLTTVNSLVSMQLMPLTMLKKIRKIKLCICIL